MAEDKERTLKVLTWKLLMEGFDREAAMDLAKVAGEMPRGERVYAALEGVGERWPTWFGDRVGDYAAGWGRELLEEGKMEESEKRFRQAIDWYKRGYNDELETPPGILAAYWNLSVLYDRQKRYEESIKAMEQGLAYAREMAEVEDWYERRVRDFEEAIEACRKEMARAREGGGE